ncbi:DNA methylase [compost metagenome]
MKSPILKGDCMDVMPQLESDSFYTCVTSPPYWGLRDYGIPPTEWPEATYTPMAGLPSVTVPAWTGCLGLEPTPEMFVAHTVCVFREVWRLLRPDGTLWINYGDSYAGAGPRRDEGFNARYHGKHYLSDKQGLIDRVRPGRTIPSGLKPKNLVGIPWRVAFALQADGWFLRMDNIWNKTNPMPESVTDRPTKAHEYFFLLAKSERYYFDHDAIKEHMAPTSIARLSQNLEGQRGSDRANGGAKVNGPMKAVGKAYSFRRKVNEGEIPGQPKQHREDREDREYSGSRNKRSVWSENDPMEVWRWIVSKMGLSGHELFAEFISESSSLGSVWSGSTAQFSEAHFAVFPEWLIEPCVLAGAPVGGRYWTRLEDPERPEKYR